MDGLHPWMDGWMKGWVEGWPNQSPPLLRSRLPELDCLFLPKNTCTFQHWSFHSHVVRGAKRPRAATFVQGGSFQPRARGAPSFASDAAFRAPARPLNARLCIPCEYYTHRNPHVLFCKLRRLALIALTPVYVPPPQKKKTETGAPLFLHQK